MRVAIYVELGQVHVVSEANPATIGSILLINDQEGSVLHDLYLALIPLVDLDNMVPAIEIGRLAKLQPKAFFEGVVQAIVLGFVLLMLLE